MRTNVNATAMASQKMLQRIDWRIGGMPFVRPATSRSTSNRPTMTAQNSAQMPTETSMGDLSIVRGRSKVSPTATAVAADVPGPEAVLTARHLAGYCPSRSAYQGRALLDVDAADTGVGEREEQLGHLGGVAVELADAPLRRHEHRERHGRQRAL